jgi:DNA-binding transcriptional regulator YiaG
MIFSFDLSKTTIVFLSSFRQQNGKNILAAKLGVSLYILKNWAFGRIHPNQKSWWNIRALQRSPIG